MMLINVHLDLVAMFLTDTLNLELKDQLSRIGSETWVNRGPLVDDGGFPMNSDVHNK